MRYLVFAIDIDGTLTENGGGEIHLPAVASLRHLEKVGHKVIYVTGRSSIEAYVLAVFCGTTKLAVGENGGAVMSGPNSHILLGSKDKCKIGYDILKQRIDNVTLKPVFDRMTEIVLMRTFDINKGQKIFQESNLDLNLSDSKYAYHINEKGINKSAGLLKALELLGATPKQTIAIGDSETDIPMFDISGFSIALNHAEQKVKDHAKYVARGKEGSGLVEAIEYAAFNYTGVAIGNDL